MQFWPILDVVKGIESAEPFVIGLYYGNSKPTNLKEYLHDFVTEFKMLQDNGIECNGKKYSIRISAFICDAPARSFVKGVKSYSGYYGCDKYTQPGKYEGRMTFPKTNVPLHTDVMFDEMVDEEHHHQQSPLSQLDIGMVSLFPLHFMHLVSLGVMKKMLNL